MHKFGHDHGSRMLAARRTAVKASPQWKIACVQKTVGFEPTPLRTGRAKDMDGHMHNDDDNSNGGSNNNTNNNTGNTNVLAGTN